MSAAIPATRHVDRAGHLLRVSLSGQERQPLVHYWRQADSAPFPMTVFVKGVKGLPPDLTHAHVILPQGGEMAARDMLGHGAERVLFADAALNAIDAPFIGSMVQALGADRVGVYLPVQRAVTPWSARPRTTPEQNQRYVSCPSDRPCWEVLYTDGRRTGIDAKWWAKRMLKQGVSCILIGVDYTDKHDYKLVAEFVRQCGKRLWLSPLTQTASEWGLKHWTRQGNVHQFVLDQCTTHPTAVHTNELPHYLRHTRLFD